MTIYYINPKSTIDSENIVNIMSNLIYNISYSIYKIYNIVVKEQYDLMIKNISNVINNFLKIYNFQNYGITNIYVQIYNQNIVLVFQANVQISKYNYISINSNWSDFYFGTKNNFSTVIYNELSLEQKNNLRYSIISNKLYYLDNIEFIYNNLNTRGLLLKPKFFNESDCNCEYTTNSNNVLKTSKNSNYTYVTTLYWN